MNKKQRIGETGVRNEVRGISGGETRGGAKRVIGTRGKWLGVMVRKEEEEDKRRNREGRKV